MNIIKMRNAVRSNKNKNDNTMRLPVIPGISQECLLDNIVIGVAGFASRLFGCCEHSGMFFPYRDFKRKQIYDPNGKPVGRLLDYTGEWNQLPGAAVHAYVPNGWWLRDKLRILTLVVGEHNALALCNIGETDRYNIQDGLEISRTAVLGLTSVFGFHQHQGEDGSGFALVPELQAALKICRPNKVVLAHDRFSCLDIDLSIAAVRLKSLLPNREVAVFPYSVNEPAAMVDALELMGREFELWSANRLHDAVIVSSAMTPETLAYIMLKKQLPFFWQRWAYDMGLHSHLRYFLSRTNGPFRQQVIDLLLMEPLDGWPNSMSSTIRSWGLETTTAKKEPMANHDTLGAKLFKKADVL